MKSVAILSPAQWYGWPSPRELIDPFLKECTLLNVSDATASDADMRPFAPVARGPHGSFCRLTSPILEHGSQIGRDLAAGTSFGNESAAAICLDAVAAARKLLEGGCVWAQPSHDRQRR